MFASILLVLVVLGVIIYLTSSYQEPDVEVHTYVDGIEVDPTIVNVQQIEEADGSLTTVTTYEDGTVVTENTVDYGIDLGIEHIDHPENPLHDWHDDGGPVHPNDAH
jgi:hypothetical protein